jgi:hypothetical protein
MSERGQIVKDLEMMLQTRRVLYQCSWGSIYDPTRIDIEIERLRAKLLAFDNAAKAKAEATTPDA